MSEKHDEENLVGDEPDLNRRKVLTTLGLGTVGATGFGVRPVSAGETQTELSSEIQRTNPANEQKSIRTARQSSEFESLKQSIQRDTDAVIDTDDPTTIMSVDENEEPYTVVSFDTEGDQPDEGTEVNIAVAVRDGKVPAARATRTAFKNGGEPERVRSYATDGDEVVKQSTKAEPSSNEPVVGTRIIQCKYCKEVEKAACAIGCSVGVEQSASP